MEKIAASLLATAGIACAQTYNYDSSSETLVITGKGNTVADRITLEGPITPGSTVPGTSEIFGDTKEIILKDVWTSPDSIRIKYVEPTSEGNNTTLKLENSRLGASGDFDKGGTGLILILDSQSSLELYGNRLTNTIRIENQGNIRCTNGTVSASSYLWDNKTTQVLQAFWAEVDIIASGTFPLSRLIKISDSSRPAVKLQTSKFREFTLWTGIPQKQSTTTPTSWV